MDEVDLIKIREKLDYYKKIPYELWNKDDFIAFSFEVGRMNYYYIEQLEAIINDIDLTEIQKLAYENARLKYTLEQFMTRKN